MKESRTNNRQHTHLLSDGIQAGSSPRSFRVVALLDQCADFVCKTSLSGLSAQSPWLSALGSLRRTPWRKCQPPAFSSLHFWHPCCWAPLLLGARRDAYLVQGGNPPRLVFSGGRAPSCGRAPVQLRQVCNHPHSLAHRFTFTFCWSTFIIVIVLIISDIVIIIMLLKSLI